MSVKNITFVGIFNKDQYFMISSERKLETLTSILEDLKRNSCWLFDYPELRAYIEGIETYAQAQLTAFITVFKNQNFLGATHYPRLLADCCIRAYIILLFNDEDLTKYLTHYFSGKDPGKMRYKQHKRLNEMWKDYIKQDYPLVVEIYNETNQSVHFSNYYYHNFINSSMNGIDSYASSYSEDGRNKLLDDMINLSFILREIMNRINTLERHLGLCMKQDAIIGTDKTGYYCIGWVQLSKVWNYLYETFINQGMDLAMHYESKNLLMGKDASMESLLNLEIRGVGFIMKLYRTYKDIVYKIIAEQEEAAIANYKTLWVFGKKQESEDLPILDINPLDYDKYTIGDIVVIEDSNFNKNY